MTRVRICFTGHRPDKLGGYEWYSDKNQQIRFNLSMLMQRFINKNKDKQIEVMLGGALGLDQFAFDVCHRIKEDDPDKIKLIMCIPFADQYVKWPSHCQDRYFEQCQLADKRIYVDREEGYQLKGIDSGIYHVAKLQKRNAYMVDRSDVVFAIWDGSKGGTANCVNYARKKKKTIVIIDPATWKMTIEHHVLLDVPLEGITGNIKVYN